jgi:ribose 5-phosphate isomerase B
MKQISESELEELVQRIVRRTLGGDAAVSTSSADDSTLHSEGTTPDESGPSSKTRRIALGADHGGYSLKEKLKPFLQEQGYLVDDCGTHSQDSVDYPDFAYAVAIKVSEGQAWRGIIIDGAGIGSCMAANKVSGVRAAMCYDHATALNSREHNNANVLTLGAGMIEATLARQIVITFLNTNFGGGRHARRVDKIMDIERR